MHMQRITRQQYEEVAFSKKNNSIAELEQFYSPFVCKYNFKKLLLTAEAMEILLWPYSSYLVCFVFTFIGINKGIY